MHFTKHQISISIASRKLVSTSIRANRSERQCSPIALICLFFHFLLHKVCVFYSHYIVSLREAKHWWEWESEALKLMSWTYILRSGCRTNCFLLPILRSCTVTDRFSKHSIPYWALQQSLTDMKQYEQELKAYIWLTSI